MKLPIRRVAAFLLSFLLLLQVGGAAAAGFLLADSRALECQDEVAATLVVASHAHSGDHAIGHAGSLAGAQSDCTAHCALGVINVVTSPIVEAAPFSAPLLPEVAQTPYAPDRIERPPKHPSC
jgi:hypothetical protein